MKTNKTPLSKIHDNPDNPRTISPEDFELLINSILGFPKMLEIRPIVVDAQGMILGGNMRYKALLSISEMGKDEAIARIGRLRSSEGKSKGEVRKCTNFWLEWFKSPHSPVVDASTLTEAEREEFIAMDNVYFGQWDWDKLENFTQEELADWGVRTWGALKTLMSTDTAPQSLPGATDNRERIIVIFPRERRAEVERLLRISGMTQKQVYRISELVNGLADE